MLPALGYDPAGEIIVCHDGMGRMVCVASKRVADGEVEGKVAAEVGVHQRIAVAPLAGRVYGLHACVEAQDEEVEVEADADAVGHGYLTIETVEAELPAQLVHVVAECPDVAGIDIDCSLQFPEELGAVFDVDVELDVARLEHEVDVAAIRLVAARPEAAHRPAAHAVGTAREVAFLERQYLGVAVGICHPEAEVEDESVALVDEEVFDEVEVALDILGIGDVEYRVSPVGLVETEDARDAIEQVARTLDAEAHVI